MKTLLELFDELCEYSPDLRASRLREIAENDATLAERLSAMLNADDTGTALFPHDIDAQKSLPVNAWRRLDRSGYTFGAYRMERELGAGGMGAVWLAQRSLGSTQSGAGVQQVAIKFMHRSGNAQLLQQFERERDALARLEHPNIARLIDAGLTPEGEPYIACEFVDGTPLIEFVRAHKLPLAARLQLIEALCEAVDYAHRRLLVHRDIKPSNVMVDSTGRVRLLDFGIAKALDAGAAEQTRGNPLSPAYAAPEQALGQPVSTATDVFGLGLLLFELLTGQLPAQRRALTAGDMAHKISQETIEAPSLTSAADISEIDPIIATRDWTKRLRGDLDLIVLKALKREPERRYASALALAEDLRRFRMGQTIAARPDTFWYQLQKLVARNLWASIAVVLAVCAMTGLTVWALQSSFRAEASAARTLRAQTFLLSIFSSADQTQTQGEKLTAKDILASAAARLDTEFKDDPAQQVELKLELAQIYENVLDLANTEKLAAEALKTAQSLKVKAPHLEAKARRLLASCAYSSGRFQDALKLNTAAVSAYAALGDSFQVKLGEAQIDQGVLYGILERVAEADDVQIAGLRNIEIARGQNSVEYADALATRGLQLQTTGRFDQARQSYAKAALTLAAKVGEVHPKTTKARLHLAGVLDQLGRSKEAELEFARVIPAMRTLFDNRGAALAGALFHEANFLVSIGKTDLAEKNFREVIAMTEPSNFVQAHALRYLGQLLTQQGKTAEAMATLSASIAGYRQTFGEANAQIWRAEADLGDAMFKHGLKVEALRKQTLAVDKIVAIVGLQGSELIRPLRGLAVSQLDRGDSEEAARLYAQAINISLAKLGETHPITCKLRAAMAMLPSAKGGDDAVKLLEPLRTCQSINAASLLPDDAAELTAAIKRLEMVGAGVKQ